MAIAFKASGATTLTAVAQSITVTLPTNATGDFVIIVLIANSAARTFTQHTGTSGWNESAGAQGTSNTTQVWGKKVGASEANPVFDVDGGVNLNIAAVARSYSGQDPNSTNDGNGAINIGSVTAGANFSAPTITPSSGRQDDMDLCVWGGHGTTGTEGTWTTPAGYGNIQKVYKFLGTEEVEIMTCDRILTSNGPTGNQIATYSNAIDSAMVIQVALKTPPAALLPHTQQPIMMPILVQ